MIYAVWCMIDGSWYGGSYAHLCRPRLLLRGDDLVSGCGLRVSSSEFVRVTCLELRIWFSFSGVGCQVSGSGFSVYHMLGFCAGFRISDFGFRTSGFRFQVLGFGFQVSSSGIRDSGFGFRVGQGRGRVPASWLEATAAAARGPSAFGFMR